jgi:F0F1-type ATP synthase alpha subunit
VKRFEEQFHRFLDQHYPDALHEIERTKDLSEAVAKKLTEAAVKCKQQFLTPAA